MKELSNSQPPTAEPSKKKKRRRSSIHYTDKKRKTVRTQKIQSTNAPIKGRGTPEDLSLPKPSWRLDCEIRPFLLSPIVEKANGRKAQTMAEVEELGNDSIQEDSDEETNSTSVVRILRVLHILSCLSTQLKWKKRLNFERTISEILWFVIIVINIVYLLNIGGWGEWRERK